MANAWSVPVVGLHFSRRSRREPEFNYSCTINRLTYINIYIGEMQSIRPPGFMTGRGLHSCVPLHMQTRLRRTPNYPTFSPSLFLPPSPSTRAHCERCVDCGNNSILASLHLHLLAFMVHLSVVIRILVQAKDLMITR